ncbi:hypothetical protein [Salinispora mooreana]|uniref:hypothetical protein n=1 Tax=Salinispora mooreana TaxID=999545 RepID=UPI0003A6F9C1|nr:hypothetical protein [Salinispora mooreana]
MGALTASRTLPHATKGGHCIEPGEVRTMPLSHDEVAEAAVTLCGKDLGAHVNPVLAEEEIRAHLSASLPRQLVPWFLVFLDHLPHAVNGKIDRNELPARVTAASRSSTSPRTEVERTLADIWREALAMPEVVAHDNFFTRWYSLLASAR